MNRGKSVFGVFWVFFIFALFLPSALLADYQFTGLPIMQNLAVREPATPDSLFHSWTGRIQEAGEKNFGASIDFLHDAEDEEDWEVILSATGSLRRGKDLLFGVTLPWIIRDPQFNESGLLDLRAFARKGLYYSPSGFGVSGELSAILPTAGKGRESYPLSLDTPVIGARLAFFGGRGDTKAGAGVGYQSYLQSETGDDSDILYSLWLEKLMNGPWSFVAEYASSTHNHSGAPGDDSATDGSILFGLRRTHSSRTNLGVALGTGIGEDKFADIILTARAVYHFGAAGEVKPERKPKAAREPKAVPAPAAAAPPAKKVPPAAAPAKAAPRPGAVTVIMMAEKVGSLETQKRVVKALRAKGYATGMDPDPGIRSKGKNVLYFMAGMKEKALEVSRALVDGGHLKALLVEESKVKLPGNWLLLVLGEEK